MKKLIVVVMALITIFSASVSVHAVSGGQVFVDWQIVDTLLNLQYNSTNCTIVKYYTSKPTPSMVNSSGVNMTQETTYSALLALYETVTVDGASFADNALVYGQFYWYEYGGYCWIKYVTDNTENTCWVANRQGKILYCDAPTTSNGYTISAIAGATGYCLTDRPAGTTGSSYLGDLCVSQDNLTTIHGVVSNLGGAADYYTVLRIVNGEYRYYIMCTYPNRTQYFVCNTSGQLYYALKDEADSGGNGGGSSFDATEVITAINSVYDALDYGFWDVCNWLDAIQDNISSFNTDVLIMSQNMTNGFADLRNVGNTINTTLGTINSNLLYTGDNITSTLTTAGNNIISSVDTFRLKFEDYFHSLGKSYPQLMTVKLSGNDNFFEWNEGDIIQDIRSSNPDGEVHIRPASIGDYGLGYSDLKFNGSSNGYTMATDNNGYHRIDCISDVEYMPESLFVKDGCYSAIDGTFIMSANYKCTELFVYDNSVYSFNNTLGASFVSFYAADKSFLGTSYTKMLVDVPVDTVYVGYTWRITSDLSVPFCRHSCSYSYEYMPESLFVKDGCYSAIDGNFIMSANYKCTELFVYDSSVYSFNNTLGTSFVSFYAADKSFLGTSYTNMLVDVPVDTVYVGYTWRITSDLSVPFCRAIPSVSFIPNIYYGGNNHILSITLSHGVECDYIFYDSSSALWKVYRGVSQTSFVLPDADQEILNEMSSIPPTVNTVSVSEFVGANVSSFFNEGVNHIAVTGDTAIFIDYYHNGSWFDYMYSMMDKLYERIGQVDGAVVNIENTVVDIVQDNDAFNVFYVEKSDGTTESVGDAATDAAKVVGEFLSIFYRLVFEDALSNADIIHDFEDVYTDSNTGVNVW